MKTVGLIVLELLFLLIPHNEYNGEIWLFFGLNAAFCFIILQYTFILDAANLFCVLFKTISDNGHSHFSHLTLNLFRIAKTFTTAFLYGVALITSVGFYFMYGSYYECFDNFVFVSFNLIMCLASSVISLVPVVRDATPQMGLFQCAVTSAYCTYVMWLAFSSEPRTKCNPSDFNRFPGSPMTNIQVWVTLLITFSTLVYISTRDLVAPQFGKVDKTVRNSVKLAYNLYGDRKEISQTGSPEDSANKDNLLPRNADELISNVVVSDNLKLARNLHEDENKLKDSLNKVTESKKLELSASSYSLDADFSNLKTNKALSSLKSTKTDATAESESVSLVWDNTLFSCAETNRTSASDEPLVNPTTVTESGGCATTGTPTSLTLTGTKCIANGGIYPEEKKDTRKNLVSPKHLSNSSNFPSLERRDFSTIETEEGLKFAAPKRKTGSLFETDFTFSKKETHVSRNSPKCLANPSDSPLIENSDFATKGVPESLSLTAIREETEIGFDKCLTKTTEEHFTTTNPKSNHSNSPLLECNNPKANETPKKANDSGALIWDDEIEGIEYNYTFFHLTFSLASLYLVMSITNWYRLDEGEHLTVRLVQSWSAVWLRISASIFCSFILIWSMIIPVLFPETYKHLLFFQYLTSTVVDNE